MQLAGLKVGLTYDRRSDYLAMGFSEEQVAEFDSDITIDALEEAIRATGARPDRIGHARMLCKRLVDGDRWDLVFNIAEGVAGRGREAEVPCILEVYGIPCTFSDPLVCAVTLDKAVAKRVVQTHGLNTPRFHVAHTPEDLAAVRLPYPLFAKPIGEGTGKGIDRNSLARTPQELDAVCRSLLQRLRQPVLIEEFLPGREFTVGVLGTGADARVLGTMEVIILPHANTTIYSYEVKEKCEEFVRYERPPRDSVTAAVEQLALDSFRALELRDGGRADIRLDRDGRPSFMEINPLPGLHPHHSDLPMIAAQEGLPYPELIGAVLRSALRRLD